jgi:phosphate transport system permease protein
MTTRGISLSAEEVVLEHLKGRRVDARSALFQALLLLALLLSLTVLIVLLVEIVRGAWGTFVDRGTGFITASLSSLPTVAGVWQGVVGSVLLMMFVVVIAFPLGIAAAVYLEEYAPNTKLTRFIDINIRNLAGVPAVVYGILGIVIFVKLLEPITGGKSVISGGVTMAILVLPIVIITSAEALRAVPDSIREAGFGVGATRWEVIRHHVLPSAAPGILTGTVLSLSRALGETAPLILIGAITGFLYFGDQSFVEQLQGPFTSLPTIIYSWSKQPNLRTLVPAAIVVLLGVVLLANTAAIVLRNRYEQKW